MTKAQCLLELWNATPTPGLGRLNSCTPTLADAQSALDKCDSVDHFYSKKIGTNFKSYPVLENRMYDRDAGEGKMQEVADGVADYIGPSKKLNKHERIQVMNEANASFKIVTNNSFNKKVKQSSKFLNSDEMINWLKKNRTVKCNTSGLSMYLTLLRYDISVGKSGYDKSSIPQFDMTYWDSIVEYATNQATINDSK
tara:strand:- start:551 stop:1141 length:591 start_codon:yes stop_codon:yes gene_type:complete